MNDFAYNNIGKILFSLIVGLFALLFVTSYESPETKHALYSAWCKANNVTNITLVEWNELRAKKLLPGQPQESNTYVPVVVPIVTR